jgi:hypothetical protein
VGLYSISWCTPFRDGWDSPTRFFKSQSCINYLYIYIHIYTYRLDSNHYAHTYIYIYMYIYIIRLQLAQQLDSNHGPVVNNSSRNGHIVDVSMHSNLGTSVHKVYMYIFVYICIYYYVYMDG